jgi:WD40 repeat protein
MSLADIEPTAGLGQSKAKIFISYSRRDLDFADRLEAGLKARGFDTLIDRSEIYALEDWWKRIEALIAQADAIVFALSPDSVTSDVCQSEVRFAASLNKRLAPVVSRRVDDQAVPEALARLNFIFFDDEAAFGESLDRLCDALETDIDWVRRHTEFGEHARRWAAAGRPGPRGLLLRSPTLEEAERWIASRPRGAPTPTEDARAFIVESRRAATQRRNILSGSLGAGLLVALVLAGVAFWQRGVAVEQEKIAREQRDRALLSQSQFLTEKADTTLRGGDLQLVALIALQALPADMRTAKQRPLWPQAVGILAQIRNADRAMAVLIGHTGAVEMAAFSPDGTRIVTASDDNTARLWDAKTGSLLTTLIGHTSAVASAAFSPDGTRILTASADHTARLWDAATGTSVATLTGHTDAVDSAAFSPDGTRIVTASADQTARVWDGRTGALLATLTHQDWVMSAMFSPDGARIVTTSQDDDAQLWDAKTGAALVTLTGHTGPVNSAAWSPDGTRIVTTSYDHTARLWDAKTGATLATLTGHADTVSSAVFSPDGTRVVTASYDHTARLWDGDTGAALATLTGDTDIVWSAVFSPDGTRILTASADHTARLWDSRTGAALAVLTGHADKVKGAVFSPDGMRIVTASEDGTARMWDAKPSAALAILGGDPGPVGRAAWSPDECASSPPPTTLPGCGTPRPAH